MKKIFYSLTVLAFMLSIVFINVYSAEFSGIQVLQKDKDLVVGKSDPDNYDFLFTFYYCH